MPDHDKSYKLLFSHPEMVADLLRGFVNEPWVAELDLDTLEPVSGSFVSDDLRGREEDLIWRVRWRDRWLYVYILLEFQSTVDAFMAVRFLTYVGLLYQDLIRNGHLTDRGLLPPILPVVLYNGRPRWTAAQDLADLIETPPGGLERYCPRMAYLLLDEHRYREEELAPLRNVAAALFRLEKSRTVADVRQVVDAMVEWVHAPEQAGLRRAFTVWLQQVLLPARMPDAPMPDLQDLQEVRVMLAERVIEWTQEWKEQGLREGREEGREEGRLEGTAATLSRILESKFGPLAEEHRRAIAEADSETLLLWIDRVLPADRIEDVLR